MFGPLALNVINPEAWFWEDTVGTVLLYNRWCSVLRAAVLDDGVSRFMPQGDFGLTEFFFGCSIVSS